MGSNGGTDRVSNRQLYEAMNEMRRHIRDVHGDLAEEITTLRADVRLSENRMWPRREGMAVVAGALVLGQIAARLEIGAVKIPAPSPQVLELISLFF